MEDAAELSAEVVATGLGWPEGPTVLPDGRIVIVESYRSQLTAIDRDGKRARSSPMLRARPMPACSDRTACSMSARMAARPDLGGPLR